VRSRADRRRQLELDHRRPGRPPDYFDEPRVAVVTGALQRRDVDGATQGRACSARRRREPLRRGRPVGQIIRIKKVPFTVVGVLDRKGQTRGARTRTTSSSSRSHAKKKVLGLSNSNRARVAISVKIRADEDMPRRRRRSASLLASAPLPGYQDDDFWIRNRSRILPDARGVVAR
jgi:putative ABC transport system permease protein